jgi:16S rRNA (guanine527-N7)-methyltransferase
MKKQLDFESFSNNVSRETFQKLDYFAQKLIFWNKSINLIAKNEEDQLWERHILDSYQLAQALPKNKIIADIGSGGGFPAIVVAICCDYKEIFLIESDKRKSIFLQEMVMGLSLDNVIVMNSRSENIASLKVDVLTARACSSLVGLLDISFHHLKSEGEMWLLKGKKIEQEIMLAKSYDFKYELIDNPLSDGVVAKIFDIKRS